MWNISLNCSVERDVNILLYLILSRIHICDMYVFFNMLYNLIFLTHTYIYAYNILVHSYICMFVLCFNPPSSSTEQSVLYSTISSRLYLPFYRWYIRISTYLHEILLHISFNLTCNVFFNHIHEYTSIHLHICTIFFYSFIFAYLYVIRRSCNGLKQLGKYMV